MAKAKTQQNFVRDYIPNDGDDSNFTRTRIRERTHGQNSTFSLFVLCCFQQAHADSLLGKIFDRYFYLEILRIRSGFQGRYCMCTVCGIQASVVAQRKKAFLRSGFFIIICTRRFLLEGTRRFLLEGTCHGPAGASRIDEKVANNCAHLVAR